MTTRHIGYDDYENKRIEIRAARVGLPVTAYIKKMSLEGSVRGVNMEPILAHTKMLGDLLAAVKEVATRPHEDQWLYEADLERIEDLMNETLESEKLFLEEVKRKLRR